MNHYRISGSGTPFIFQHGLGGESSQPQSLLRGLAGIQLISMDCPGHGDSPLESEDQISFSRYADEIIRLAQQLRIDSFIAGGISMGAGIAVNLALRYPHLIRALVLVRPAWLNKTHPANLKLLSTLAKLITHQQADKLSDQKEFQKLRAIQAPTALSILKQLERSQPQHTAAILQKMIEDRPFQQFSQLKSIGIPALILSSEQDDLHPYQYGPTLARYIDHAVFKPVPSRYMNNDQHQQAVFREVTDFVSLYQLKGVEPQTGI